MKSTSGAHYIALDHIRALAALMVFVWHFTHAWNGYPVSFEYVPTLFPFALLDEGHTGVSLFMTLSGYLFAKLLDGKSISYSAFLWNRILRLLPLLTTVIIIVGISKVMAGANLYDFAYSIISGAVLPSLPNGGWSITVEFHFYLILPFLLFLAKKSKILPISMVVFAIACRLFLYFMTGEVQSLSYWTIIGRIDQFVFGMLAFQFRTYISSRNFLVALILCSFAIFYWFFDLHGGLYNLSKNPKLNWIWIVLPTIEGFAYGTGIAWYESSFTHSTSGFSAIIGKIGEYSFSIYLLHFFVVFRSAKFINEYIMNISNFYFACIWAIIIFSSMVPIAYLSFRFIEAPFLKLRKNYILV